MALALYSPEDVIILLGGVYQIDGLHEGTFLSISKDEPQYKTFVSTDGSVSRLHVAHPLHTVSITTSSIADINNTLSMLAATDSKLFGVIIPLMIRDTSGTTLFYAQDCWIEEIPTMSLGDSVESREWVFKAVDASSVIGGNGDSGEITQTDRVLGIIGSNFLDMI
jgi:hypothetical protein